MPIIDIYSFRKKKEQGTNVHDVFIYDLPSNLRIQIVRILDDAFGLEYTHETDRRYSSLEDWRFIADAISREHFQHRIGLHASPREYCLNNILSDNFDIAIDTVELSFRVLQRGIIPAGVWPDRKIVQSPQNAVDELNARFLQHGVGYEFVDGAILPKTSELIHTEVVKPALLLLQGNNYSGPQDEFLKAYEHLLSRDFRDAIVQANCAFESTMKAICDKRSWTYDSGATAGALVQNLVNNGLLPSFSQAELQAVASVLKTGTPVIRNQSGGHGQGATPADTPERLATYALHLTAASIVFLIESEQA